VSKGIMQELLCARCGHAADAHPVEGMVGPCMVRVPEDCDCRVTWERIDARAIQRMMADLPVNTESDPDAEARGRASIHKQQEES
jgi:hypothetical protein